MKLKKKKTNQRNNDKQITILKKYAPSVTCTLYYGKKVFLHLLGNGCQFVNSVNWVAICFIKPSNMTPNEQKLKKLIYFEKPTLGAW